MFVFATMAILISTVEYLLLTGKIHEVLQHRSYACTRASHEMEPAPALHWGLYFIPYFLQFVYQLKLNLAQ